VCVVMTTDPYYVPAGVGGATDAHHRGGYAGAALPLQPHPAVAGALPTYNHVLAVSSTAASASASAVFRDPSIAPLRKLSVDLIKTYKFINEVQYPTHCPLPARCGPGREQADQKAPSLILHISCPNIVVQNATFWAETPFWENFEAVCTVEIFSIHNLLLDICS